MRIYIFIIILFYSKIIAAELLKPNPNILPEEVILIQLTALQNNNTPYENAGIAQTWEFAHPLNRIATGPLEKFTSMMLSTSYSVMIDHMQHEIIFVQNSHNQYFYFVEMIDKKGVKVRFQWIIEKVINNGKYKNCWMTTSVSVPLKLSQPA